MAEYEKKKENYVRGSSIEHVFQNGSSLNNFSINIKDDNVVAAADPQGWVQLTMKAKREVDKYKNTHYVVINEFKPDKSKGKAKPAPAPEAEVSDEPLPF